MLHNKKKYCPNTDVTGVSHYVTGVSHY